MKVGQFLQRAFYGDGATPLPVGICFVVYLLILFNGMVATNLSSYLPQLVKEFNVTEVETGKYVGLVSSVMSLSRIVSSILWGYICDKFGRKQSLLMAGSGLSISTLVFGFSFSYVWTVVSRSLQGIFMGLIVITKAVISDVADDTNLATGLSFIFAANNLGYIIGPSMAGFLAFPVQKHPKVFTAGSFWDVFKIILPNLIISVGLALSLLVALVLLPKKKQHVHLVPEAINVNLKKDFAASLSTENLSNEVFSLNGDDNLNNSEEINLISENGKSFSHLEPGLKQSQSSSDYHLLLQTSSHKTSKFRQLLKNKRFIISITLYALHSMTMVGYEDLFPVFAATSVKYKGLGMNTSEIGLLYLITGLAMIVIQFLVINKLVYRYGAKKVFCSTTFLFSVLTFLLPTDAMIKNRTSLWVALWVTQCLMRTMYSSGVLCVNIFINNSVESELLGLANGVGLSVASFGRSIGSVIFGMAFTWSMSNIKKSNSADKSLGFPFNQYFAFILIAISALVVVFIGTRLPESINKKKT